MEKHKHMKTKQHAMKKTSNISTVRTKRKLENTLRQIKIKVQHTKAYGIQRKSDSKREVHSAKCLH